jgi:lipid II:glycine glycyltransferase (peptidoglycan interpeptide bridge formation enzyme)
VKIGGSGGARVKIRYIDPTIDSRWDQFVADQKQSTIFHISAWARVIKDTYGYQPYYYVLEDDAGQIKAAMPFYLIRSRLTGNRLVSLPFSDYCCPLGDEEGDINLTLDSVKKEVEAGSASSLEIRGWQNGSTPSQLNLVTRNYYLTYILNLIPDLEALHETFHDSVRRGIRQAEKRGVTVRLTTDEEGLDEFFNLNVITRKKLGVLPQPQAFFKNLYRHIISQNLGFTILAKSEGKTIAGVIFLTYKDTVYYKYNASDKNYLQKRPNHLIIWEAIRYAHNHNYKRLDFGRCAPEDEGLKTYKSRWGAREINLPYYYYPKIKGVTTISEGSIRYRTMQKLSYILPKFVFQAAGSFLYKHLG